MIKLSLLAMGASLLTLGLGIPAKADSNLDTARLSKSLQNSIASDQGLALNSFSARKSWHMSPESEGSFSVNSAHLQTLHIHGFRDPEQISTLPNPEPATMLLLGSGLVEGLSASPEKRAAVPRGNDLPFIVSGVPN